MGEIRRSLRALEATNFFLADVQTGLGPFLAAYLAGAGWDPGRIGMALTAGGAITVILQTPAGGLVDRARHKRLVLVLGVLVLAAGALLLAASAASGAVYSAQVLIGGAAPFLAPTLAAITMGLVGARQFDRQFGRNQGFNSAGNVACALLIAGVSRWFGSRAIFFTAAALTLPTIGATMAIRGDAIDYERARGGVDDESSKPDTGTGLDRTPESVWQVLGRDKVLLMFLICSFFFHLANAAMLPELGEMLTRGSKTSAAPFMSACVVVTQVVIASSAAWIGRLANEHGRRPLLLVGFGVLPVRAVLYTLTQNTAALVGIQLLDGVASAIFVVVSILVVADLTRGTGRFNLAQGALATAVGIGAALSNVFGGKLAAGFGFSTSFLSLGGVAAIAFCVLWMGVPETLVGYTQAQGALER